MLSAVFIKSFRISLKLTEWQMGDLLKIEISDYLAFESYPLGSSGMLHYRFHEVLTQILGFDGHLKFTKCLEADVLTSRNVHNINRFNTIELVKSLKAK
jgi:hypothetical protein